MTAKTVWTNFGEEPPKEVPILEEEEERDPGLSIKQIELELGIDLGDYYRDIHDY